MGMEFGEGEFESFWKSMDTDGSGDIGFREFKTGVAELRSTMQAYEAKVLEGGDDDLSTKSSHTNKLRTPRNESVRTPTSSFDDDEASSVDSSLGPNRSQSCENDSFIESNDDDLNHSGVTRLQQLKGASEAAIVGICGTGTRNNIGVPVEISVRSDFAV